MYTPNLDDLAPIYHDEDIFFVKQWQEKFMMSKRWEVTPRELREATRLAIEKGDIEMRHEVKYPH